MNTGSYLFTQLMDSLPKRDFDRCVRKYKGNYRIRHFSCFDQFLCMAFAQLTYRHSLRDIETCLNSIKPKLYHLGFRGTIARNTLAKANQNRDWRIYADFAHILITQARKLYAHRSLCSRLGSDGLRLRFHHHRSLFETIPVGAISPTQSGCQAPYPDRSARQHPLFCPHFPGKNARCQSSRPSSRGSGRLLRHGSRLYRFRPALPFSNEHGVLHHTGQKENEIPHAKKPARRQNYGTTLRPNDCTHRRRYGRGISSVPPAHQVCGSRHRQTTHLPDQQLCRSTL